MTSPAEKPLLYIILGATGSGRREVVADLIEAGVRMDPTAHAAVLVAAEEAESPADERLGAIRRWSWDGDALAAEATPGASHVFFLTDGRGNPVDQLEQLKTWIAVSGYELARIICVVNCRLAEKHPPMVTWYDACIHFSDIVLLHQREGVGNKWMSDFLGRYESQFLPCLFELVKNGRVKNPALILEPQARRISHVFDEESDWLIEGVAEDAVVEDEIEDGEEEVTVEKAVDPYFERRAGGRRAKEIPDVRQFLDSQAS
jgi:hypothetical protein